MMIEISSGDWVNTDNITRIQIFTTPNNAYVREEYSITIEFVGGTSATVLKHDRDEALELMKKLLGDKK